MSRIGTLGKKDVTSKETNLSVGFDSIDQIEKGIIDWHFVVWF